MGGTRFMVQWEEHPSHLATRLGQLLEHQTLVDVTLMCNTHTLRVHRAVLAACSPYFETILQRQLGMYPLIVLKDMQFSVLKSLIEFMYCGETSVTEDNLSALLQAAKFFQVKGLSAMTKEALGLTSQTPKSTTVNGDSARKAFVGRSKRVGMQQTFVASGLKTVSSTTQAATSHAHGLGSDTHTTTTGKTIFQTTPKSVPVRQETHHQQQQQTDTAQLLLSLSGSEFPKQTFHTVSKNVRFHHNVTAGGAVTVEPSRSCPLDSSVVKSKETAVKSEVIDRVPVVTPSAGVKPASVVLPTHVVGKVTEQPVAQEKVMETAKDDLTPQMIFVEDGPCKRGRPLKRQMNLVFQEKVLTDAEMALQKEAEASRKALEMLQQEMSTGDEAGGTEQKVVPAKQPLSKGQTSQSVNNVLTTAMRILPKEPATSTKLGTAKANTVTQATAANTPETSNQNIIYQVAGNAIPAIDSGSNETNIVYQLQEGVIAGQDSSGATNVVYQVADNTVVTGQDPNSQNIIYQVAEGAVTSAEGSNNTNIIYQVADSNTGSGSAMSQYMEVLKEAGLPSDVPILLESSDGSYVTVNEEVLMNIMNGGMIQVGDGSIVGGEGVQFIVQEVQEVTEGQLETPVASAEQLASAEMNVTDSVPAGKQQQVNEASDSMPESKPVVMETDRNMSKSTHKPMTGNVTEFCGKEETKGLPPLEQNKAANVEIATVQSESMTVVGSSRKPVPYDTKQLVMEESGVKTESTPMVVDDAEVMPPDEAPAHCDEVITGDGYGEEAMEGFAVMEGTTQRKKVQYTGSDTADFNFHEQTCSSEAEDKSFPASECGITSEIPANDGMSVEQALQAMMGEGSDTEMEVTANADTDGAPNVRPVISQHDNKGHGTQSEGYVDEETEDLRLVLSPEDDSIKPEDEGQSAEDRSSYTLALSSPEDSENDKTLIEGENVAEYAEGSQPLEKKSLEFNNDTDTQISQDATADINYPSEATLTSVPSSTDTVGADTLPSEAVDIGTSDSPNPVEINGSEADVPVLQAEANEIGKVTTEINNAVPSPSNTDIFLEAGSPAKASGTAVDHTAEGGSKLSSISTDKPDSANGTAEELSCELNSAYHAVTTDEVTGDVCNKDSVSETDRLSDIAISSNACIATDTEVAMEGTEAAMCSPKSRIDPDCNDTEDSVNVADGVESEVGKSLPVIAVTESNTGIKDDNILGTAETVNEVGGSDMIAGSSEADGMQRETNTLNQLISSSNAALAVADVTETEADSINQAVCPSRDTVLTGADVTETEADSINQAVCPSRDAVLTGADVLKTEYKNDVDTELPAAAILQSFVASTIQQCETGDVLADDKESQDMEVGKEAVEMDLKSDKEIEGKETVAVLQSEPGQEIKLEGDPGPEIILECEPGQEIKLEGEPGQEIKLEGEPGPEIILECEPGQEIKLEGEVKVESESCDMMDTLLDDNEAKTELISQVTSLGEGSVQASVQTVEGAVSSPSKDIPYAVGLLPLRTALEKLQAMPEYHPRKTRSASSGKESGGEVPTGRLKRKASSSVDSLEKKMKTCDADDDDDDINDDNGVYDSEGTVAMSVKEFDGNTILDTCIAEDSSKAILKSPSPEESLETVAVGNKMEPLPSMMELVSDTSDAV